MSEAVGQKSNVEKLRFLMEIEIYDKIEGKN